MKKFDWAKTLNVVKKIVFYVTIIAKAIEFVSEAVNTGDEAKTIA